jgi:hypothetical protein
MVRWQWPSANVNRTVNNHGPGRVSGCGLGDGVPELQAGVYAPDDVAGRGGEDDDRGGGDPGDRLAQVRDQTTGRLIC